VVRHEQAELFTTVAEGQVAAAKMLAQQAAEGRQQHVAGVVACSSLTALK